MARNQNPTDAEERALNAAQVEFTANPLFMTPQAAHFWQAQGRIFDEVEKFSSAWLRRREDATRSLIDVARQIAGQGGNDPAGAMGTIADWQARSMERLAEDAKDCTQMLSSCAGVLVSNEAEAIEETAETVQRATKPSKSEPV